MKGRKTFLVLTLLIVGSMVPPLATRGFAQAAAGQASPFKDRAEYDAYNAVLQAQSDAPKALEAADKYLATYPESKLLANVYSIKLAAYQKLNDSKKMEETANKLLEIDPNNLRALLLLSYLFPRTLNAQDPDMEGKLAKATENAKKGLDQLDKLPAPANVTPDDFKKQKDQSASMLHQALGFVALQKKDYETAATELRTSSESNPTDALGFYWLGLAYLTPKPPKYDEGMWSLARASSITGATALPEATKTQVKDYLGKVYDARHGTTDGLDDLLAQAGAEPFPPQGFHVQTAEEIAPPEPEPAPTPAPAPVRELTVKAEELTDFGVIEKYLQSGGQKEADTWEILKGQSLPLPGKVVSATPAAKPTRVLLAVGPEAQTQEGKSDVELTLAAPYSKALIKGATINFEGTLDSYTAKPFVLKMSGGKIQ